MLLTLPNYRNFTGAFSNHPSRRLLELSLKREIRNSKIKYCLAAILLIAQPAGSFAATFIVSSGDSLQAVVDQTVNGDVIVINSDDSFTGNLVIENKSIEIAAGDGFTPVLDGELNLTGLTSPRVQLDGLALARVRLDGNGLLDIVDSSLVYAHIDRGISSENDPNGFYLLNSTVGARAGYYGSPGISADYETNIKIIGSTITGFINLGWQSESGSVVVEDSVINGQLEIEYGLTGTITGSTINGVAELGWRSEQPTQFVVENTTVSGEIYSTAGTSPSSEALQIWNNAIVDIRNSTLGTAELDDTTRLTGLDISRDQNVVNVSDSKVYGEVSIWASGVEDSSEVTIERSEITNLFNRGSGTTTIRVVDSTVIGEDGYGQSVYNWADGPTLGLANIEVIRSYVQGEVYARSGSIFLDSTVVRARDNRVGREEGLNSNGGKITAVNVTVANFRSGIYSGNPEDSYENMLLFGNTVEDVRLSSFTVDIKNSVFGNVTEGLSDVNGNAVGVPQLDENYNIVLGSLGIDYGNNNANGIGATDINGCARIQDGDSDSIAIVDVGASETSLDCDNDGVDDSLDNCVFIANPVQAAVIGNFTIAGDACDDEDGDTVFDAVDECPITGPDGLSTYFQDQDGDGYTLSDATESCVVLTGVYVSAPSAQFDCDDGNGSVNPGGIEIPDDGIDQDCSGADEVTVPETISAGNIDSSSPLNLSEWGSGFNASFQYVVQETDTNGGTVREWAIEIDAGEQVQITNAWMQGYNASIQTSNNAGIFTITNERQGYLVELSAGDVLTVNIQGSGGSYDPSIYINFTALRTTEPVIGAATGCANPTPISLPFSYDGQGEFCWSVTGDVGHVNSWSTNTVEIDGQAYTNQWSNQLPVSNGSYTIYYESDKSWSHFEISGSN